MDTTTLLTDYACSCTGEQALTAQYQALQAMGVPAERIYMDKGLTGTSRQRAGRRGTVFRIAWSALLDLPHG